MKTAISVILTAMSLAGLAGCDSQAEPGNASMVRYQVDGAHDRSWWLMRDGILLHSAAQPKRLVRLPRWLWAMEPLCPPDLAMGPDGEAVVTSNVVSSLWRIDPRTFAVTMHDVQLDADTDKDVGFAALVYSPEQAAFFAYSEAPPAVWKIDRQLSRGTKLASIDLSRVQPPRTASARGPCADLGQRLARFAGLAG